MQFPVVQRELIVASHSRYAWNSRFYGALGLFLLWSAVALLLQSTGSAPSDLGTILFRTIFATLGLFCFIAGPVLAADSISVEKRDGTLGLLFLTDLSPFQIVLGKLVALGINALYAVIAAIPIITFSILVGGVDASMLAHGAIACVDLLVTSLVVSLFVSSLSTVDRKALMASIATLLAAVLALPMVNFYLTTVRDFQLSAEFLLSLVTPSLGWPMYVTLTPGKLNSPSESNFWHSIALHTIANVVVAFATVQILRSVALRSSESKGWKHWGNIIQEWRFGKPAARLAHRRRWLQPFPFAWITLREIRKPILVWMYLVGAGLGFIWGVVRAGPSALSSGVMVPWAVLLTFIVKIWIAGEAGRPFAEDRRIGAHELLLTTPLSESEIATGHWIALRRQFFLPLLVMVAVTFGGMYRIDEPHWLPYCATYGITLFADFWALGWVGIWRGSFARSANRGLAQTALLVLAAPSLLMYSFVALLVVVRGILAANNTLSELLRLVVPRPIYLTESLTLISWCIIGAVWSVGIGLWARSRWSRCFRNIAALPKLDRSS